MSLILVVDDHPVTREPLTKLLQFEGFDAAGAANGAEALVALRARRPDLVLLDLHMPKMDGLAFLEAVRKDPTWHDLAVVVLTGGWNVGELRRARELGALDVIAKSHFHVDDLLAKLRTHLAA